MVSGGDGGCGRESSRSARGGINRRARRTSNGLAPAWAEEEGMVGAERLRGKR